LYPLMNQSHNQKKPLSKNGITSTFSNRLQFHEVFGRI
ncbi:MAG: hypothetical protein RL593_270, partial [Pseudomonadota bacterium]